MSNVSERRAIETKINDVWTEMVLIMESRGETYTTTRVESWGEGLHGLSAKLGVLFEVADVLGMGRWDWTRAERERMRRQERDNLSGYLLPFVKVWADAVREQGDVTDQAMSWRFSGSPYPPASKYYAAIRLMAKGVTF